MKKDDQEWLTKSYTQKALVEYSSEEEKTESESETEDSGKLIPDLSRVIRLTKDSRKRR